MSESGKDYELKVLKMMLNKYLEEITSITEKSLRKLEVDCDQIVWELATKIYSQSGHKVDLSTVRDVVNSRAKVIKYQLATEAEQKAQQAAEEARRTTIQEAHLRAQIASVLIDCGGNETKAKVFIRVRRIISDQLSIEENEINLNSHLLNDLEVDADSYDLSELITALEEEFDIEISNDETEDELSYIYCSSGYSGSGWSIPTGYSFSGSAGEKCVVTNFVDLIHKKLYS